MSAADDLNYPLPQQVVGRRSGVDGTMTGTATITSARVLVGASKSVSFQNKWTGTPVGAFVWDGSNDEDPDNAPVQGWTQVTPDPAWLAGNPDGAADTAAFDWPGNFPLRWARQRYVNESGTGVLTSTAQVGR